MEYQVPQFIEIESKIVGPLTLRQFIYLAGTAGFCIAFFFYLPLLVAVLLSLPIGALGISLAFYKVNGKPFISILEAGFNYYTKSKLFLWKQHQETKGASSAPLSVTMRAPANAPVPAATPRLTSGKLSELAWSLDMQSHEREMKPGGRESQEP